MKLSEAMSKKLLKICEERDISINKLQLFAYLPKARFKILLNVIPLILNYLLLLGYVMD